MPKRVELGVDKTLTDMYNLLDADEVFLTNETRERVEDCRNFLNTKINENSPIYGEWLVELKSLRELQLDNNRIKSLPESIRERKNLKIYKRNQEIT